MKVVVKSTNNRGHLSAYTEQAELQFKSLQAAQQWLHDEGFEADGDVWKKGPWDPQPGEWTSVAVLHNAC